MSDATGAGTPLRAKCPACRTSNLTVRTHTHDVAYFGACLETLARCETCGFRHADFFVLEEKAPVRYTLPLTDADDLAVRVVRSNSGTIRVPELGFTQEPTGISEAYITNVEGVFDRIRSVLLRACVMYRDTEPEKVTVAERKLEDLARMLAFETPARLIVEDPRGNSAILTDRAERVELAPEEADELATGMIVFDKKDLEDLR